MTARLLAVLAMGCLAVGATFAQAPARSELNRARELLVRELRGEKLPPEDSALLQRVLEARWQGERRRAAPSSSARALYARETTGLKPLTEMTADDRYEGEDGGLYGGGRNTPTDQHLALIEEELAQIKPLNQEGKPSSEGVIGFISISMSNATQEFSVFKRKADADEAKSKQVVIVDCAQGGQAMAEWAPADARPWSEAQRRLEAAGIDPRQVQVAWVKLANKGPQGDLKEHGGKLKRDTLAVVQNAKQKFPNLRIVYLGSRIYGGYTTGALNPEPYAYESAFAARWLIQDQLKGNAALNYDPDQGIVKAPLLLWGPYFWGDGTAPRKGDKLVWNRDDFVRDGTHPSDSGRAKVADMMLTFFKSDPLAKGWFTGASANR